MNEQKAVNQMTDLELGEIQGGLYQQLMQAQQNLIVINQEFARRKAENKPKEQPDEREKEA